MTFLKPGFSSQSELFESFSNSFDWLEKSRPSKTATSLFWTSLLETLLLCCIFGNPVVTLGIWQNTNEHVYLIDQLFTK